MKIRRYREEDSVEEVIRRSTESIETSNYTEEEQRHLEKVIPRMNLDFAEKDRYIYYVAVEEEKIVGLAGFQKESGKVSGIFVDPDRMKEGIGSRLLGRIEEKAREEGREKLVALASLDAEEFYSKNGYNVVGEEETEVEGKDIPLLVMEKEL